jgi:hypothetical protein
MSIEQKIAELLAESRKAQLDESNPVTANASAAEENHLEKMNKSEPTGNSENEPSEDVIRQGDAVKAQGENANPDNARNDARDQDEAIAKGQAKKKNKANDKESAPEASHIAGMKEDIDAMLNGEELTEEFKTKAATIFEAAVMTRVKAEVARIEEEFEAKLEEAAAQNQEGLVEKVDGYLDYVVEQWIAQNELALERGMKSEILEGFVSGLKGLFEEHYIDMPEEKFDVMAEMEDRVAELEEKLNEQLASNVELKKSISEMKRAELVSEACVGLSDTQVEKLKGLAEELSYEDADTFAAKVQTIRENYFTTKAATVSSVVTDTPVETLTEEKVIDPSVKRYMHVFNNIK